MDEKDIKGFSSSVDVHEATTEVRRGSIEIVALPSDEKRRESVVEEIQALEFREDGLTADGAEQPIIVTGADAAIHLLPLRDDFDPSLTFRGIVIATALSGFQAVMNQIYQFKPTQVTIGGVFIVLIAYFLGKAWAFVFPDGEKMKRRWKQSNGEQPPSFWVKFWYFINPGSFKLKEHSICAITATSASNASQVATIFSAQILFYDLPISAVNIVLTTLSVGLFGYGLIGLMRSVTVWHVECVYWSTLPTVKVLQGLHWQDLRNSKPLRYFWYAFCSMFAWEWFPAYMFPWLNSVSVPCLASQNTQGYTASVLTNIFGGSVNNEGLGMFSLSFDWQYTTSFQTSLPLKLQLHQGIGLLVCMMVMLAIYYSNAWNALNYPFMSTQLLLSNGTTYPTSEVFTGGILNQTALNEYGPPALSGTFAYGMFIANAAIGALIMHVIVFWGPDLYRTFKDARVNKFNDPHHEHMAKHYKEVPWWWYALTLVVSFIFGLIVVLTQDITLPAWGYVVSLILGSVLAPFSTILYARYGNGIATNNLSKMIAGLALPGRPIANMYFAGWSHNVITCAVGLANDLKLGEYLKIAPRVMFLTQVWGTIIGGFINYVVMISIVTNNRALLLESGGDNAWTGAYVQSYNTNAASWAMAQYLYKAGTTYAMVPGGLGVGALVVLVHRIVTHFMPRIKNFALEEINMPQFIQYAGYIPYNQSQTCVLLTWTIAGFFCQYYLRNWHPRFFKDYMYLITGAWDGAAFCVLFILSFAVFGAGGVQAPFPAWWGNNVSGYYDYCPVPAS